MIVCIPVDASGQVDPRWGRAARVAVGRIEGGRILDWREHEVGWDSLHDAGTEGGHHARVARFLAEHGVQAVLAHHMGPPMRAMLDRMGIVVELGVSGDARLAARAWEPPAAERRAGRLN